MNHHQLLNEYVLYNFFAFYRILVVKSNYRQYNKLKRRNNALLSRKFALALVNFNTKIKGSIFFSCQLFEKLDKRQKYLSFMMRQQKVSLKLYHLMII